MRISSLDLLRYGRFQDRNVAFGNGGLDLHVIVGANEAGKTTMRSAISDLMFGFGHSTTYGFRHGQSSLRVGATVQHNGSALAFQRRKGRAQTLRDADDAALPDNVLQDYVGGRDRDFFERMFSLDHPGLVRGGQDLLEARDDLGRMLFQSANGVGDLGKVLEALEKQADGQWAKRAGGQRTYTQAEARFKAADKTLKDVALRSASWREATEKRDAARVASANIAAQVARCSARQHQLRRLQATLPRLAQLADAHGRAEALADVPLLVEDAAAQLTAAERELAVAGEAKRQAADASARAEQQLAALTIDETILARAGEVEDLGGARQRYAAWPQDIVKREAELRSKLQRVAELARQLGWTGLDEEQLRRRLPNRMQRDRLTELAGGHARLGTRREEIEGAVGKQQRMLEDLRIELDRLPAAAPSVTLHDAIERALGLGDVKRAGAEHDGKLRDSTRALAAAIDKLRPWTGTVEDLRALRVPSAASLDELRQRTETLTAERKTLERRRNDDRKALEGVRLNERQIARDERPVAADDLAAVRRERDGKWQVLRGRLQAGDAGAALAQSDAYEVSLHQADGLADRRFELAAASTRLTQLRQEIEQRSQGLEHTMQEIAANDDARTTLDGELAGLQTPLGLAGLTPAEIDAWLRVRLDTLRLADEQAGHEDALTRLRGECATAADALAAGVLEAEPGGGDALQRLRKLLAAAKTLADTQQKHLLQRAELARQLDKGQRDLQQMQARRDEAVRALEAWREEWSVALGEASLERAMQPSQAAAALELMRDIEASLGEVRDLRELRIAVMKRDLDDLAATAARLGRELAPGFSARSSTEIAAELTQRLEAARRSRSDAERLQAEIADCGRRSTQHEQSKGETMARLAPLLLQAGSGDVEALRGAVVRSDRRRQCECEAASLEADLLQLGSGLTLDEMRREAEGVDRDALPGELAETDRELHRLGDAREAAGRDLQAAETALAGMQGQDAAARASEDRQQALAEMGTAVERWTRLTVGARLRRAAIDRYRERKQAPLLRRAEQIFATLTLGEFASLAVAYEDSDQPRLLAVRRDGEQVGVDGLSTGTADQLFLALRIAAIEDYLGAARPLPFVADDLFINFDEARAKAGFKVLAELAGKTQVLFFTHHQHLAPLAQGAGCGSVNVVGI